MQRMGDFLGGVCIADNEVGDFCSLMSEGLQHGTYVGRLDKLLILIFHVSVC